MKHYGDITKLSGYDLPVVDCITGGSPCQDLSVAGKRAGLEGERSGLFMEQIRIIKEMREKDGRTGRTGQFIRPRYAVWENVPGAYSSNGGKDFQAVLTEFIRIAQPDAPDVPMPEKGRWGKAGCLYDELGRWSVAWRTVDAQYWGTPQRRKRIALVADFGGTSASSILFEQEGVCGDFAASGKEREGTAGGTTDGVDEASRTQIEEWVSAVNSGANHQQDLIQSDLGVARTIAPGTHAAGSHLTKTLTASLGGAYDVSPTTNTDENYAVAVPQACDVYNQTIDGDIASTITAAVGGTNTSGCKVLAAGFSFGQSANARTIGWQEELSPTLRGGEGGNQKPCIMHNILHPQD